MIKNIFITSRPGTGKTTLIKEILEELKIKARGFFTEEIRLQPTHRVLPLASERAPNGERIGFKIVTLSGKTGILAEKGFKSPYRVSKYGVILRDLEEIGVKEIEEGLKEDSLIIVDELGLMELYSAKFKKAVLTALNSENKVLGTIMLKPNLFCDEIKKRPDTKIFYLTRENREEIKKEIINLLAAK